LAGLVEKHELVRRATGESDGSKCRRTSACIAPRRIGNTILRKAYRRMSVDFSNNPMSGGITDGRGASGGMPGNPVTRAAITDIAGMAAKKMMGGR
jgi:hypothetical protein